MYLKLLLPACALLTAASVCCQGLNIRPGTTFKATSNVNVVVKNGNLLNNGGGNLQGANVYLTGGAPGTIGGAGDISVTSLYIDKPASTAYLGKNMNVGGNVVLVNGMLDLNSYSLALSSTGLLIGETEANRITGALGGYLSITVNLDAPLGDNPGNLGAQFASSSNLGSVTIQRGHRSQTKTVAGKSIFRYYSIKPSINTGLDAIFRFRYFDAELNGLTESDLYMWRGNSGTNWTKQTPDGRNTSLNFIDIDNVDTFAIYTLSSSTFSLQREGGVLTAANNGDKVLLEWPTGIDINWNRFIIERSNDNITWHPIGSQPAKSTGFTPSFYNYIDDHPTGNEIYYRIRKIDISSDETLTNTAKVTFMDKLLVTLTPNPVQRQAKATVIARNAGNSILSVFGADGKRLIQQPLNLQAGINQVDINTAAFAAGMYYLVVEMKDGTRKMVPFTKQ